MSRSDYGKAYSVMLLGILGVALGMGIVLFGIWSDRQDQAMIRSPDFALWLVLIGILSALLVIFPVALARNLKELKPYYTRSKFEIGLSVGIFVLWFSLPRLAVSFLADIDFQLVYFDAKMYVLNGIALVTTVLPAAVGIWSIHVAARTAASDPEPHDKQIQRYLRFQELLQQFITILGTVVALVTLATGASRRANIAAGVPPEDFPLLLVLLYGAFFTILTALLYFPTSIALSQAGRRLRDTIFPIPPTDANSWADVYSKREKLEELLRIRTTAEQNFRTGMVILAPLLSAIISLLLKA